MKFQFTRVVFHGNVGIFPKLTGHHVVSDQIHWYFVAPFYIATVIINPHPRAPRQSVCLSVTPDLLK